MVAKLFWQDPYRTSIETRVAAIEGEWMRLEETIFYAFSGGQESDAGTIGDRRFWKRARTGETFSIALSRVTD